MLSNFYCSSLMIPLWDLSLSFLFQRLWGTEVAYQSLPNRFMISSECPGLQVPVHITVKKVEKTIPPLSIQSVEMGSIEISHAEECQNAHDIHMKWWPFIHCCCESGLYVCTCLCAELFHVNFLEFLFTRKSLGLQAHVYMHMVYFCTNTEIMPSAGAWPVCAIILWMPLEKAQKVCCIRTSPSPQYSMCTKWEWKWIASNTQQCSNNLAHISCQHYDVLTLQFLILWIR